MTLRIGSLCSGYEGLGMAVQEVLGGELAWVADNDPGAAAILAHRFPSVPNLSDITTADWSAVEPVDVLTAGFPCQPISLAGKRLGEADERWIWPEVARAVRDLRPGLVYLENVAALVARGLPGVAADLAAIGYVGSWRCIRASDIGAPHARSRVFIAARPAADTGSERRHGGARLGGDGWSPPVWQQAVGNYGDGRCAPAADTTGDGWERCGLARRGWDGPADCGSTSADATSDGRDERRPESARLVGGSDAAQRCHELAADADGGGRRPEQGPTRRGGSGGLRAPGREPGDSTLSWGIYGPAIARWETILGRPAPRPTEPGRTGERLSPRFVEWMQGLPDGWVTDVPGLSRNAQLKALGNGVVPAQAVAALRLLLPVQAEAAA